MIGALATSLVWHSAPSAMPMAAVPAPGEIRDCWRDAKTKRLLAIYPISSDPDPMRPGHRSRPEMRTPRGEIVPAADFVLSPDGWWIDAVTGRTAVSVPSGSWPSPHDASRRVLTAETGGRDTVIGAAERVACQPRNAATAPDVESAQVMTEINRVRAHPAAYAAELLKGSSAPAVLEAAAFLERQPPMPPLDIDPALRQSATRHVVDQGRTGSRSHLGTDGSTVRQRVAAAGLRASLVGEEIAFDADTAAGVVRQLVIDEGVPDRDHRAVLFHNGLASAGAACGPHAAYRMICVIDVAGPAVADRSRDRGAVLASLGN